MKIEDKIRELIEKPIQDQKFILDEIIYVKENGVNFLRIVIDKENSVNVDDCVKVTEIINPILDEHDLIEESYILDICSKERGN